MTPDIYCSCRGRAEDSMICCDFCDEWYHLECAWITQKQSRKMNVYRCQACCIRQGATYAFEKKEHTYDQNEGVPTVQELKDLIDVGNHLLYTPLEVAPMTELVNALENAINEVRVLLIPCQSSTELGDFKQCDLYLKMLDGLINDPIVDELKAEKWRQRCFSVLSNPKCKIELVQFMIDDAQREKVLLIENKTMYKEMDANLRKRIDDHVEN